ncbi:putative nuclease HARBI1 [Mizuhopecten yessoensis]|uniref:putative nuclease HARBI1 n=1 Tax=Mizuhopecten yessoensis TaxID=6573 RepID=UPI000B45F7F6|nr:putative nuclease HARBI1 [Mizuhopecten yessoensis]
MAAMLLHLKQNIPRRLLRDRKKPLDYFSDEAIIASYRLDRQSILELCNMMTNELSRPTHRNRALPVSRQVMVALRYYAYGSYMSVIGDAHGVSKMAVSRAINHVSLALARRSRTDIVFPMDQQQQGDVKREFLAMRGFHNVLGAVGGSLIPLRHHLKTDTYMCQEKDYMP